MTEPTPDEEVVENDGFRDAVRSAVRPIVIGLAVMIAFVGVAGGIATTALFVQAHDIKGTQDEIVASRIEGAAGACRKDNNIRRNAGRAAREKAEDFVKLQYEALGTTFAQQTPKIQALTLRFYAEQEQVTLDSYPHRDCSTPEAIAEFNRSQPPDPEPCVPAPGGLCAPNPTTTTTAP